MKRIFVLEYLSGGGLADPPAAEGGDRELLAAGVAMRDAIVADLAALDGVRVSVASARGMPDADLPRSADRVAPMPGESVEAFVRRLAHAHDASWIVAPETGGVLGRLCGAVGDAGWLGCDEATIACASSKSATHARLAERGVPTPRGLASGHRGRWIVKPDDGAGTLATRLHADRAHAHADLAARRGAGRSATMEPFIEGEALSVSMIVGANLAGFPRIAALNRQRITADADGWLHDDGVEAGAIDERCDARAPALRALAWEVADAMPGLRGFVGLDLIWNEERGPVLIEVNPRVTMAYVGLSRRVGRNLAADVLRCAPAPEAMHVLAP